ncbi:hypothetical protein C8Q74DRAFT_289360 [Fomes fomentarius]|nr:hypothetical protein C8Q74DRAFT_289360 [Fomes fomentarius]
MLSSPPARLEKFLDLQSALKRLPSPPIAMSDDAEPTTNLSKVIEGEHSELIALKRADDVPLAKLGYRSEFRREFSLFETIAFAFSIMGLAGLLPRHCPSHSYLVCLHPYRRAHRDDLWVAHPIAICDECARGADLRNAVCPSAPVWPSTIQTRTPDLLTPYLELAQVCITSLPSWRGGAGDNRMGEYYWA